MASEKTLRLPSGGGSELLERADHAVGPVLAVLMSAVGLSELDSFDKVEAVALWGRVVSWAQARQAETAADVESVVQEMHGARIREGEEHTRRLSPDSRSRAVCQPRAARELAMRLGWTRQAAAQLIATGVQLRDSLPATGAELEEGRICWRKATVIADGLRGLALPLALDVEEAVLPRAPGRTPTQLQRDVAQAVTSADPEGAVQRHQTARAGRRVSRPRALPDGMATVSATLPAEDALRMNQVLDAAARRARSGGDGRSSDQIRADTLVTSLLEHEHSGERASEGGEDRVNITVPLDVLLDADGTGAAELEGYGAIDPLTARAIAAGGIWRRIVTDPLSGALLDLGRRTYRPSAALARNVRARDGTCTRPGCTVSAEQCELDHVEPFAHGGATSAENLTALCSADHRAKSRGEFDVARAEPGVVTWASPTGHIYRREVGGTVTHASERTLPKERHASYPRTSSTEAALPAGENPSGEKPADEGSAGGVLVSGEPTGDEPPY